MKPTADDPNPYGSCGSCRHWIESEEFDPYGCCDIDDGEKHGWMHRNDTCPDYARREEP